MACGGGSRDAAFVPDPNSGEPLRDSVDVAQGDQLFDLGADLATPGEHPDLPYDPFSYDPAAE